jgi:hypothetical protein
VSCLLIGHDTPSIQPTKLMTFAHFDVVKIFWA